VTWSRIAASLVASLALAGVLVGCGAESTAELDKGELVEVFEDAGLSAEQSSCVADAVMDADLSEEDLTKVADGEELEDTEASDALASALSDCGVGS
jgi:hypothetical protein